MIKILLFLAALVVSMFLVLYSELTWQLIIVYGKQKLVLNFWFALLVLLFLYLLMHWLLKQFSFIFMLPDRWRQYRWKRMLKEKEYARGQSIIYALTGDYKAALGHMPVESDQTLSDQILLATWLNQLKSVKALDEVLAKMVSLNKIPDGWMIWFRAYLLFERGKTHLATDLLLDAIESRVYTAQIVKSFVLYADPKVHFYALLKHYPLLSRFVPSEQILPKILNGAMAHMDQLLNEKKWDALNQLLNSLPKEIRKDKKIQYYWIKQLVYEEQRDRLLTFLSTVSFEDERLIPLIANLDIVSDKKIDIVKNGLEREPKNKNLRYLLSYLHAQEGAVDDTVRMLESAISEDV